MQTEINLYSQNKNTQHIFEGDIKKKNYQVCPKIKNPCIKKRKRVTNIKEAFFILLVFKNSFKISELLLSI